MRAINITILWLAMAVQSGAIAAQSVAAPDVAKAAAVADAEGMPVDTETELPFPARAQIAANTPPGIRAMTAVEEAQYGQSVVSATAAYEEENATKVVDLLLKILSQEEATFGPDHPETLGTLTQIEAVLRHEGRYAEAEPVTRRALAVSTAVLGQRHPDTITSLSNHAFVLQALGRPAEAEPLYAEALRMNREGRGEGHSDTLTSLNNYASILQALGRAAEAEPLFAQALRVNREENGERHPDTLLSLNNYAGILESLGRAAEAEPLYAQALQINRELQGERHPDTLRSLNNYAGVLDSLGRAGEAVPLYAEALRISREVLGERHPQTLTSLNNYAYALDAVGRAKDAEPLYAEALRLRREVQGERHPDTLTTLSSYAYVLDALGRSSEAESLYAEALRLRREVQGERHPDTLITLSSYAFVLQSLGRAEEAEPLYAQALRLTREVQGERHPATLRSLNNYAFVLDALDRTSEALPLYAEALRLRREVLGESHPDTLRTLSNYAMALQELGQAAQAEPLYAEALQLNGEVLGVRHPQTLISLNNYAGVLNVLHREVEAEPFLAAALRLRREVLGERHPQTLTSLNNYAAVLRALGRLGEAELLFADAQRLRREVQGERHPATISSSLNLAYTRLALPASESEALAPARLAMDALHRRFADTGERGIRGEAQQERDRKSVQGAEQLFADAAWTRAVAMPGEAASLRTESFAALQGATAGAAARAIAQTAARRYAESADAGPLVAERTQLVEVWSAAERRTIAAQARSEGLKPDARAELDRELAVTEARIRAIDAQLKVKAPQYSAIVNQPPLDVEQAQALLGEDEAVLMIVPTGFGTHIMALTKTDFTWRRSDLDEDDVGKLVAKLRRDLNPDEAPAPGSEQAQQFDDFLRFDRATAYALYVAVIDPIAASLVGKSTVFIAADGALASLPFGVLITEAPETGSADFDLDIMRKAPWFADAHALVQIPSLQSLAYLRNFNGHTAKSADAKMASGLTGSSAFAGYGDPLLEGVTTTRGGRGAKMMPIDANTLTGQGVTDAGTPLMDPSLLRKMASLPGTAQELGAVRAMLGAPDSSTLLLGDMTEGKLRTADLSGVRILHLATHGLTASESGSLAEPGLVFTPPVQSSNADDGYLAASEVLALDLSATQWVILSACNTAAPSGKPGEAGLSGLARAFFYAGASSLLVSHWPVFDSVAAELTVNALRRTQNGESRAAALQGAMRDIRNSIEQPEFAHPGAWAAFTLAGEGQ